MTVFEGLSIPKVIYKTHSDINGDIEVVQDGKTLRLRANRVTQSVNYDSPVAQRMFWGRLVQLLKDEVPEIKSALILGLGGGTMQQFISKVFQGIYIVSVELDPVIVDVAKQFFDTDEIPNHKVITEDACRVIVSPEDYDLSFKSFSVAIVDICCGSDYPELGKSGNFLAHVSKMVVPGGLVVINRIYLDEFQEDVDVFIDNVSNFLRDVKTLIIPGKTNADNMLIYGRPK